MASRKCATKYQDDYIMEFSSSSDNSDTENEEFMVSKPKTKEVTLNKRTGVERQPTRKPDPKVVNRNALLARENRRRKKEHLQTLEDQVEKFQCENVSMRKTIKQQAKMIKKLQKEKMYYKNLLQSQPQIVNVLEKFNKNFRAGREGNLSLSPTTSTGSSSPFSIDFNDNDINSVDYKSHDPTDYDLLGINSPFHTAATPEYFSSTDCLSSISEEHNYTSSLASAPNSSLFPAENDLEDSSSGICLHIAGDKVSVEFCAVCCENAKTVEGII